MATPLGRPKDNGMKPGSFTAQELKAFVNESPENAISFAVNYAPTPVYNFIRHNYGNDFPKMATGMEATGPTMESMCKFLEHRVEKFTPGQVRHFMIVLFSSLPAQPQVANWTTPSN